MQIKHMFSLMDDFGVPMTSLANHWNEGSGQK
jgi:hypothetical protein